MSFIYYRFIVTKIRNFTSANSVQMSRLIFQNSSNNFPANYSSLVTSITNPNGNNPSGEAVSNLIDGSISSKWLDFNIKTLNISTILIQFNTAQELTSYTIATANDSPERDPVSWTLEGSNDNQNWDLLSEVNDHNTTTTRQVIITPSFDIISSSNNDNTNIPCLTKNCNVLTIKGYKNIEKITKEDIIITSKNEERKIKSIFIKKVLLDENTKPYLIPKGYYNIKMPLLDTSISKNHLYYNGKKWIKPLKTGLKRVWTEEYITYYNLELEDYKRDKLIVNGIIMDSWDGKN